MHWAVRQSGVFLMPTISGSRSLTNSSRNYFPRASVTSVSKPPILEEATLTFTTAAGSGKTLTTTGTMALATSLLADGPAHSID
ncbi:hypothetical protein PENSPDRAFT_645460 [Peniophora sp. CONT]|nr:hypothetical protein PENSPDRAFT_645460 [Peniophora sp. CONT]